MSKKESPRDKSRRVYAELESAFSGMKTIRGPHPMGALGDLLAPVAILQQFGTSAKICQQIDTVEAAAIINRDLPGIVTEEREKNAERFNLLAERLLYQLRRVTKAEEKLALDGWEFDPEENILKSKMVNGSPGNRPQIFLLRCIEAAADNLPALKGEPLREAIAQTLWLYFPADVLATGAHGNIARTLENYRRK